MIDAMAHLQYVYLDALFKAMFRYLSPHMIRHDMVEYKIMKIYANKTYCSRRIVNKIYFQFSSISDYPLYGLLYCHVLEENIICIESYRMCPNIDRYIYSTADRLTDGKGEIF